VSDLQSVNQGMRDDALGSWAAESFRFGRTGEFHSSGTRSEGTGPSLTVSKDTNEAPNPS